MNTVSDKIRVAEIVSSLRQLEDKIWDAWGQSGADLLLLCLDLKVSLLGNSPARMIRRAQSTWRAACGQCRSRVALRWPPAAQSLYQSGPTPRAGRPSRFCSLLAVPGTNPGVCLAQIDSKTADFWGCRFAKRPGNVRELENTIAYAVGLALDEGTVKCWHLPEWITAQEGLNDLSLEAVERKHILYVLDLARGNKSRAAKILGKSDETLRTKLKEYKGNGFYKGEEEHG